MGRSAPVTMAHVSGEATYGDTIASCADEAASVLPRLVPSSTVPSSHTHSSPYLPSSIAFIHAHLVVRVVHDVGDDALGEGDSDVEVAGSQHPQHRARPAADGGPLHANTGAREVVALLGEGEGPIEVLRDAAEADDRQRGRRRRRGRRRGRGRPGGLSRRSHSTNGLGGSMFNVSDRSHTRAWALAAVLRGVRK